MSFQEDDAIRQFLFQCSVPIVIEQPGSSPAVLGNGTLFEINSRAYLVTAQHVLKDADFNSIGVVTAREPSAPAWTFKGSRVHRPSPVDPKTGPDYDIALIELRDAELLARLKSGWRFLGPNNIGVARSTDFLVAGYPDALRRGRALDPSLGFLAFRTVRRDDFFSSGEINLDGAVRGLDIFFGYEKEGMSSSGKRVKMPALQGISGASIWGFTPTSGNAIWTVEHQVKVVAVETAYVPETCIRAQSWAAVAHVLYQIDPMGADEVASAARDNN